MNYFLLKQDKRYSNTPSLKEVYKTIPYKNVNLLDEDKIEDNNIIFVKADEDTEYLDILDTQIFLISEKLKKIIEKYDTNIIFKRICLIDKERKNQNIYYLPIFREFEVLHEKSEFNLNKTIVKKIILDEKKIKNKKIFKIKESDKTLIVVRLDAAESLLRREFKGIALERLQVEK